MMFPFQVLFQTLHMIFEIIFGKSCIIFIFYLHTHITSTQKIKNKKNSRTTDQACRGHRGSGTGSDFALQLYNYTLLTCNLAKDRSTHFSHPPAHFHSPEIVKKRRSTDKTHHQVVGGKESKDGNVSCGRIARAQENIEHILHRSLAAHRDPGPLADGLWFASIAPGCLPGISPRSPPLGAAQHTQAVALLAPNSSPISASR